METTGSPDRLVIHDRPYLGWLISLGLFALGIWVLSTNPILPVGLTILGMGALMLVLSGAPLTIIADRNSGTLTLQYNYLVYKNTRQYALDEIVEVMVQRAHSRRSSATYRVALLTDAGNEIPLRNSYSSGYGSKEKTARRLSEFLGLGEPGGAQSLGRAVQQALHGRFEDQQSGQTSGVSWQLESGRIGNVTATRWFSADFQYPGQFLLLAQKPEGSSNLLGDTRGMLGGVSKMLYRQLLNLYGIDPAETPGLENAVTLDQLSPQIERHFMALAGDPFSAQRLLNPWVVRPLADWAARHPLRQGQPLQPGQTLQLVVLFSPLGVRLSFMNASTPEQAQELIALGAEVVSSARA